MLVQQTTLNLSPYSELYDMLVPADNELRRMNDLVDFSFVYKELLDKYTLAKGRPAEDPIRMFKYLLLKVIYELSDVDVVAHSLYDLSFKYFLGYTVEETNLINPSSLTKFRKMRLKDKDLLDMLIGKTVEVAVEKGIIKKGLIIVDATHSFARSNPHQPLEVLRMRSKKLRKSLYEADEDIKSKLPEKNTDDDIQHEIDYCNKLVEFLSDKQYLTDRPAIGEKLNYLKEGIEDILDHFTTSTDEDARIGHKTEDSSFFGYKTHIAMDNDSRIITAAVVTSGEANDGQQLPELIEQSKEHGLEVEGVIGDTAYSGRSNLELGYDIYAKLHPVVNGNRREEDKFQFNKDAGMYVCPAGHMATSRFYVKETGKRNPYWKYMFDVEKCKICPLREGCYKEGARSKTYSVSIAQDLYLEHKEFQESQEFKDVYRNRYKIEAKNAELKQSYGYGKANAYGLQNMQLQGAVSIFACNLKRIIRILDKKD